MAGQNDRFFITAVTIAARLSESVDDVANVSLQTMNAQSLINRAGEGLRPIRPIASYMNTLSTDLAGLVEAVNKEALEISRVSLGEFLEALAVSRFESARRLGEGAVHIGTIDRATAKAQAELDRLDRSLGSRLQSLKTLLSHIETTMLSVEIVLSSLRLEVGKISAEYKPSFESLIGRFEEATMSIKSAAVDCRRQIETQAAA